MLDPSACSVYLPEKFSQLYSILTGDGWKLLLAFLGVARAVVLVSGKAGIAKQQISPRPL